MFIFIVFAHKLSFDCKSKNGENETNVVFLVSSKMSLELGMKSHTEREIYDGHTRYEYERIV